MATIQVSLVLCLLIISCPFHECHSISLGACLFDSIYQLGDSISDTGNLIRESAVGAATPFSRLPYGETFFRKATGRCSNGLLMIDYIALAAGLPFLNPYLDKEADFRHGVNFAVAGATALPTSFLAKNNIVNPFTNSSLDVQLNWMETYFNSTCHTLTDCREKIRKSLFLVGEIGGNDYNYALFQGKSIEDLKINVVPYVVQAIKDAVRKVINFGAVRVVVPGNFPFGCFPIYLTGFKSNDSMAYDELNCLKELNNFSIYQNDLLQRTTQELSQENPNAVIVYADYYNAFLWVYRRAAILGFDVASLQKSCCGVGGDYNFNLARLCGTQGVPVCSNPERSISWDGIHLTQKTYSFMAQWLIHESFPKLRCFI